jgi:hypothetical protein
MGALESLQATRGNPNFAYLARQIDRIKYAHGISYPLLLYSPDLTYLKPTNSLLF